MKKIAPAVYLASCVLVFAQCLLVDIPTTPDYPTQWLTGILGIVIGVSGAIMAFELLNN